MTEKLKETQRLLSVVHDLRTKCPWDKKQTHKTLIPYLLEEAYEVIEAIEKKDRKALREELGDLLLQIALHAEISTEKESFSFEEVAKDIANKMIRRHPHIYEGADVGNLKSHLKRWTKLKSQEKPKKYLLEGTPKALPALQLSQRYGEIAASVGFDWPTTTEVFEKIEEELEEFKKEWRKKPRNKAAAEMEFGDLLFTLTRIAGHLGIDAERALRKSASKFYDRFGKLEDRIRSRGLSMADCDLVTLEKEWTKIKKVKK